MESIQKRKFINQFEYAIVVTFEGQHKYIHCLGCNEVIMKETRDSLQERADRGIIFVDFEIAETNFNKINKQETHIWLEDIPFYLEHIYS
jgi:hypothetical protein